MSNSGSSRHSGATTRAGAGTTRWCSRGMRSTMRNSRWRRGPRFPDASAGDAGVLELVQLGPAGHLLHDPLDRGARRLGVTVGTVHQPHEYGLVTGDERGDAPDVVIGGGRLVFLAH